MIESSRRDDQLSQELSRPHRGYRELLRCRRARLLTGLALPAALLLTSCGSQNFASSLATRIRTRGARQLRGNLGLPPTSTLSITNASCTMTRSTRTYSCRVLYTVDTRGATKLYQVHVTGLCTRRCRWHANGPGAWLGTD